jgi:plasmid stability protein
MSTLTIRKLDDDVKSKLRVRAAQHGRSMEEEARVILRQALQPAASPEAQSFGDAVQAIFAPIGGWNDFEAPKRDRVPDTHSFDR